MVGTKESGLAYDRVAIALHWLIAAGVLVQISLGWWMTGIPKSPPGARAYWFNVHKSIGITLGVLILVRLAWRLTHRPPGLPESMPAWQRVVAAFNHALLYVCMVVMPVAGYLGSSFTKYPIKYWGYTLPHWGWDDPALKDLMSQVHYATVIIFMSLIALHVAAALKHRFFGADGIFERMWAWPPRATKESSPHPAAVRRS